MTKRKSKRQDNDGTSFRMKDKYKDIISNILASNPHFNDTVARAIEFALTLTDAAMRSGIIAKLIEFMQEESQDESR